MTKLLVLLNFVFDDLEFDVVYARDVGHHFELLDCDESVVVGANGRVHYT